MIELYELILFQFYKDILYMLNRKLRCERYDCGKNITFNRTHTTHNMSTAQRNANIIRQSRHKPITVSIQQPPTVAPKNIF